MSQINLVLLGMIAMGCFTISLLFSWFWRTTRDRFFLFFAIAFFIEACSRLMLAVMTYSSEQEPLFYLLRLFAFLIILLAIVDKNRNRISLP